LDKSKRKTPERLYCSITNSRVVKKDRKIYRKEDHSNGHKDIIIKEKFSVKIARKPGKDRYMKTKKMNTIPLFVTLDTLWIGFDTFSLHFS